VQVRCSATQRGELRDLVEIFRLGVIDVGHSTMTLEVQGREDKMSAIVDLLEPYGAATAGVDFVWGGLQTAPFELQP
jgi:acetolactate synthase-1/3 small subunit